MRKTLNIDDVALQAATKSAQGRAKTEVINEALLLSKDRDLRIIVDSKLLDLRELPLA